MSPPRREHRHRDKAQPWSVLPSQFAVFVANEVAPARLLEVGCGNGRDSLFFSSAGFDVVAAGLFRLGCETVPGSIRGV
jgi:SAM-dependent methyltransferase